MEVIHKYEEKRNNGDKSIGGVVVMNSVEQRGQDVVRCKGNFWPKPCFVEHKKREPYPVEISWEEDENGVLTEGVLIPKDKDWKSDDLPSAVWQIYGRRTQAAERKKDIFKWFGLG